MGRVEEAMRRAAEQAAATQSGTAIVQADADVLANTAFPGETSIGLLSLEDGGAAVLDASATELPSDDVTPDSPYVEPDEEPARVAHSADLNAKLVADQEILPASREQYRRLAATLHQTQSATGLKVVMLVSAMAGEGKTLTACNLALTFSESYKRTVLLIDADLRRPSLHTAFKLAPTPGLSDDLMATEHRNLPVHRVSERLSVLTAGRPTSDPMAGLTSDRMRQIIDEARMRFDWVILDTPPVGLLTDASLLGAMADGAVMVVKAGVTPYQAVQRAIDALGRDHILGAVLNRASLSSPHGHYYSYDYYYGTRRETERG